jgi:hypothetical protein
MDQKNEKHGEFVAKLGDRMLLKYTDGGPALNPPEPVREPRNRQGKGGRFARSVRRNALKRMWS